MSKSDPLKCPECGSELPRGLPPGLCPICALLEKTELVSGAGVNVQPGECIGRYKLLQQIGEGGCGVVFMAQQEEPIRRKVALKVIKLGMDTRSVIARFEAERQALALMDHPNIAKVLDAGATEMGRPYFVMELVRGVKMTDYCDQHNLSMRARLNLFMQVCHAVQHAHQKGIIHRDIKPSNILVTMPDGPATAGVPKVIDFGIAKATSDQRLTDKTLFTAFEQFMGTPAYMSPEQAGMSPAAAGDIDTRSDIYSLGVLLYELLTGKTPFDAKELLAAGLDKMRRTICDEEPARPSNRLGTMLDTDRTQIAKHRQTDPAKLTTLLRGDLDWIVMKALEKDRIRRYETANGLALDVQRHLSDEPVLAGPPSVRYRLKKFVRKYRTGVAVAAAFFVLMAIAISASTWLAVWANRERKSARNAERTAETAQARAEQNAAAETKARAETQWYRKHAEDALANIQIQRSEDFFGAKDAARALAYLAAVLRSDLSNRVAAERLMSALTLRTFCLPLTPSVRQGGHVDSAEFSRDGLRVVMISEKTARVWDVMSGKPLTKPLRHQDRVWAAQFSPDGQKVATTSGKRAWLWDVQSGEEHPQPLTHEAEVLSAQFSPDGSRVLTVCTDREAREDDFLVIELGAARVWDVQTGKCLTGPLRGEGRVNSAQFSADGTWVLTACSDKSTQVWESSGGKLLTNRIGFDDDISSAQFSPDGLRTLTVSGNKARLWDGQMGVELTKPLQHDTPIRFAEFSPDGLRVVTTASANTAQIWDAQTGRLLTELTGHDDELSSVQFSPDGLRVLTSSMDGTVRIWDASTGQALNEPIRHNARVLAAQFSSDGMHLVTAWQDGSAQAWEPRPGIGLTEPLRHSASLRFAEFSPDGLQVITASRDKTACVWKAQAGKPTPQFLHHEAEVLSARVSPDGRRIVTASSDRTARLWDAPTGMLLYRLFGHEGGVFHAEFSPDGLHVVTASADGTARVWKVGSGELLVKLRGHEGGVFSARFAADGRRVVTASSDKTARVWDVATGVQLLEPLQHEDDVISAQFSGDGRWVVTASRDKTARLWNATTGKPLTEPLRHDDAVWSAQFSPDGTRVVTSSWDKTARLWDSETGKSLSEPLRHDGKVWFAQFSPDGLRVVTASADGRGRVWDAQFGMPLGEPFRHEGEVVSARFSPDGLRVITASSDNLARVWEVPIASVPAPAWLPQLATIVAGQRLKEAAILEPVAPEEFLELKAQLQTAPATERYTRWVQWFLADRSQRTISPFSTLTVPDYVHRRIDENTVQSLREAIRLSPTNGLAFARLAQQTVAQMDSDNPRRVGEANFFSRRAIELSPNEPEVQRICAKLAERSKTLPKL